MSVSETRLYGIWADMKARCNNPSVKCFPRYGGRGITVCAEWLHDFKSFENWAYANGYREYLTLDRIDNTKGYSPDNCRWATKSEQAQNRRTTRVLEICGERKTIHEWATTTGIPKYVIAKRVEAGDSGAELIRPVRKIIRHRPAPHYEIDGVSKTAKEWADEIGIAKETFLRRWRSGRRGPNLLKPNRQAPK